VSGADFVGSNPSISRLARSKQRAVEKIGYKSSHKDNLKISAFA